MELTLWRLCTGIALGATLPNITALIAELSPKNNRAILLTFIGIGISFGAIGSGLIAPIIIEAFNWNAVFWLSSIVTLGIWILLYFYLPTPPASIEKIEALVELNNKSDKSASVEQTFSGETLTSTKTSANKKATENLFLKVLNKEFRMATLSVWCLFTGNAFIVYVLASWLPVLLINEDWSLVEASSAIAYMQGGGLIGGLLLALLMDRWQPLHALLTAYIVSLLCFMGFSLFDSTILLWGSLIALIGAGISGVHMTMSAVISMIYPANMLSSGIGFTVAIARLGAVAGPIVGGIFIGQGISSQHFLLLLVLPVIICLISAVFLFINNKAIINGSVN